MEFAIVLVMLTATQAAYLKDSPVDASSRANVLMNLNNQINSSNQINENFPWPSEFDRDLAGRLIHFDDRSEKSDMHAMISLNTSINSKIFSNVKSNITSFELTNDHATFNASLMKNHSWLARKDQTRIDQRVHLNVTSYGRAYESIRDFMDQESGRKPERCRLENASLRLSIVVLPGNSIQSAIDAAAPGDNIEIQGGTYRETVYVDKQLVIRGVDVGGGLPIIDAGENGNAILISADGVSLERLIAINSSRSRINGPGAGIKVTSNNCHIRCIITYDDYYGISLKDSNNNTIVESNLSGNEDGARLYSSGNNTLKYNDIKDSINGIRLYSSNNNTIWSNNFTGNDHDLDLSSSNYNCIENNSFTNNSIQQINIDESSKGNKIINNTGVLDEGESAREKGMIRDAPGQRKDDEPSPVKPALDGNDGGGDGLGAEVYRKTPTCTEELQKRIDEEIERLPWGQITFTPPKEMFKGESYPVVVRVSRSLFENMTKGLEKFEKIETEQIKVSYEMNAGLDGGSSFDIFPQSQEPKILPRTGFVEWKWEVMPKESGTHTLKLTALATIGLPNGERSIEEKVFEREILVYVDSVREIKTFFLSGGEWALALFVTTLIGGVIALLSGSIIERIKSLRDKEKGKQK